MYCSGFLRKVKKKEKGKVHELKKNVHELKNDL